MSSGKLSFILFKRSGSMNTGSTSVSGYILADPGRGLRYSVIPSGNALLVSSGMPFNAASARSNTEFRAFKTFFFSPSIKKTRSSSSIFILSFNLSRSDLSKLFISRPNFFTLSEKSFSSLSNPLKPFKLIAKELLFNKSERSKISLFTVAPLFLSSSLTFNRSICLKTSFSITSSIDLKS